jgi:ribosomal protein L19E
LVGCGSKKLTIEPTTRNQMKMAITAEQLKLIPKPAGPRRRGRNQPKHGTGMKVIS